MSKAKTKKTVTTEVRGERIEFTAEVVPGESIRIFGRKKTGMRSTGVRTIRLTHPDIWEDEAMHAWVDDARAKLARLPSEVVHNLSLLLLQWHRGDLGPMQEGDLLLRDAFLHDAEIELSGQVEVSNGQRLVPVLHSKTWRMHAFEVEEPVWQEFDRTFHVGEEVVTGSYNLIYTARIVKITAKKVVTNTGHAYEGDKHFTLEAFASKNWDLDMGRVRKHNDSEMQCI